MARAGVGRPAAARGGGDPRAGGHVLDGTLVGTGGHVARESDGLGLETQHVPDSPNQQSSPGFPSTTLRPGETDDTPTVFDLSLGRR